MRPDYGHYDIGLGVGNSNLEHRLKHLESDVLALEKQAVLEAYHTVNDAEIAIAASVVNPLLHFCVDGKTVIDLNA